MKHGRLLALCCTALALASLGVWWREGRAIDLVDAPGGKLDCLSYTPPHDEQLLRTSVVPRAQLQHDLALLAPRVRCVRIYSVANGMDQIPSIARELGLKVLLGLWIGADAPRNQQEIKLGLEVAERNRDVVEALIVGNEVLLRHELTAEQLGRLITQVNDATDIPVTYADVWDFWKANPSLALHADFLTIHLLPYWDDKPTGIDAALAHTASVYGEARVTFPNQRVFIGETGWPSQGRQRADAVPGVVAQARFVREFTGWAHDNQIQYNLIEAFDQPWKRQQEGTVGGYWGLYDTAGLAKFALQGAVQENTGWTLGYWSAGSGALAALLLWLWRKLRREPARLPLLLPAGALLGALLPMQWQYLAVTNRGLSEWLLSSLVVLAGNVLFIRLLVGSAVNSLGELPKPANIGTSLRGFDRRGVPEPPAGANPVLGLLRLIVLIGLSYVCLGLAIDARYRGFPISLYVLPLATLTVLQLERRPGWHIGRQQMPEEWLLTLLCGLSALVFAIREGLNNQPALLLAGLVLCFAVSQLGLRNRGPGQDQ
jgi:exo-beta-1,3-glucanase (GH17 family)